jgi:myo-inositol-1(or 4)-monophosphatase
MDPKDLADAETQAVEVAWGAGRILMGKFLQPLTVAWKGGRPGSHAVTEVDRAAEAYVQEELLKRFPRHAILGEEGAGKDTQPAPYTWVVDPLDGTTNYINGLPAFACSIGLLEHGVPVVGVAFIPWPGVEGGMVLRAHVGGGTWIGERRLTMPEDDALAGRLVVLPRGAFRMHGPIAKAFGERRSVGSIVYEMAASTQGIYRYVLFNSPKVWDVAAGIVLIREAGGAVMTRPDGKADWTPFETFAGVDGQHPAQQPLFPPTPGQEELRKWALPILGGAPAAVGLAAGGIKPHHPLLVRAGRWARTRLKI